MGLLKSLFGHRASGNQPPSEADDPIIAVPIPPLVSILLHLEREKGAPLSEEEVWNARDGAICMTMHRSWRDQLAAQRGYPDVDMENAWSGWQAVRQSINTHE